MITRTFILFRCQAYIQARRPAAPIQSVLHRYPRGIGDRRDAAMKWGAWDVDEHCVLLADRPVPYD